MPYFKEVLMSSGEFWIAALILIGFGFLLGCSAGAFVAVAIIATGLVLSLAGAIGDRIFCKAPRIPAPPR
jgi:hypothetical protein